MIVEGPQYARIGDASNPVRIRSNSRSRRGSPLGLESQCMTAARNPDSLPVLRSVARGASEAPPAACRTGVPDLRLAASVQPDVRPLTAPLRATTDMRCQRNKIA